MLAKILCVISILMSSFLMKDKFADFWSRLFEKRIEQLSKAKEAISVPVAIARKMNIVGYLSVGGKVRPERIISICTVDPNGSRIEEVTSNKILKKGDSIVKFESESILQNANRYNSMYAKEADKFKRLLERKQSGGHVSDVELTIAECDKNTTKADYLKAKNDYQRYSEVQAPFEGTIGVLSESKREGAYVRPGDEICKYASEDLIVQFFVPQSDLARIKNAKNVKVLMDDNDSTDVIDAEIVNRDCAMNNGYCLEIHAKPKLKNDHEKSRLTPNSLVSVKIPQDKEYSQQNRLFTVWESAVCVYNDLDASRKDERSYIFVVNKQDLTVRRVYVTLRNRDNGFVEIEPFNSNDLEEGFMYVKDGGLSGIEENKINPILLGDDTQKNPKKNNSDLIKNGSEGIEIK